MDSACGAPDPDRAGSDEGAGVSVAGALPVFGSASAATGVVPDAAASAGEEVPLPSTSEIRDPCRDDAPPPGALGARRPRLSPPPEEFADAAAGAVRGVGCCAGASSAGASVSGTAGVAASSTGAAVSPPPATSSTAAGA